MRIHTNIEQIKIMLLSLQVEMSEMNRLDKKSEEKISNKLNEVLEVVNNLEDNAEELSQSINKFL